MSSESPSQPQKWFALAAAFALVIASGALWISGDSAQQDSSPNRERDQQREPISDPVFQPPPVVPQEEFVPPKTEPKRPDPRERPPEVSPSMSSSKKGDGPSKALPSIVRKPNSFWKLINKPWLFGSAIGAIVILTLWQWQERRQARRTPTSTHLP